MRLKDRPQPTRSCLGRSLNRNLRELGELGKHTVSVLGRTILVPDAISALKHLSFVSLHPIKRDKFPGAWPFLHIFALTASAFLSEPVNLHGVCPGIDRAIAGLLELQQNTLNSKCVMPFCQRKAYIGIQDGRRRWASKMGIEDGHRRWASKVGIEGGYPRKLQVDSLKAGASCENPQILRANRLERCISCKTSTKMWTFLLKPEGFSGRGKAWPG